MQEKTYVLAIVSQLNRGGLESRLMDILRKNDFERVQIDIFTYRLEEGLMDAEAKKLGCKIYYNKPLTVKNMISYVNYFRNFLKAHPEYKIIHAHQDAWCSVFCKGAYKAGVPVRIAHSRTAISSLSIPNIVKNVIKLPARKYATHFFAVSDKAGEWLFGKRMMRKGRVQIWKNAIECNKYVYEESVRAEVRKELGVDGNKVIMHVGNFTPPKNHKFLIDVFFNLTVRDSKINLVLAGTDSPNGHRMQEIIDYVQEKGLQDKVKFLGMRGDIPRLLQAADVFLFPSIFEGLPGAVLEAQAAGIPCVISDSITAEVKVLDTTKMLSLKMSLDDWAEEVLDSMHAERKNTLQEMISSGFDINSLVEDLSKFYENVEVRK